MFLQEEAKEESQSEGDVGEGIEEAEEEIGLLKSIFEVGFIMRVGHSHHMESAVGDKCEKEGPPFVLIIFHFQ